MAGMVRLTPALRRLLPDFFFNLVGCVRRKDEQREAAQHVSAIAARQQSKPVSKYPALTLRHHWRSTNAKGEEGAGSRGPTGPAGGGQPADDRARALERACFTA